MQAYSLQLDVIPCLKTDAGLRAGVAGFLRSRYAEEITRILGLSHSRRLRFQDLGTLSPEGHHEVRVTCRSPEVLGYFLAIWNDQHVVTSDLVSDVFPAFPSVHINRSVPEALNFLYVQKESLS